MGPMTRRKAVRIRKRKNRVRRWYQQNAGEMHRAKRARKCAARGRAISWRFRSIDTWVSMLVGLPDGAPHLVELADFAALPAHDDMVDAMVYAARSL